MYKVKYILYPDNLLAEKLRLAFFVFNDLVKSNTKTSDLSRLKKVNRYLYAVDDHALRRAVHSKITDKIVLDQSIRVTDTYIKLGSFGRCNYQGFIGVDSRVSKQDTCRRITIKRAQNAYVCTVFMEQTEPDMTREQPTRKTSPAVGKEDYEELKTCFQASVNRRDIWSLDYSTRHTK